MYDVLIIVPWMYALCLCTHDTFYKVNRRSLEIENVIITHNIRNIDRNILNA